MSKLIFALCVITIFSGCASSYKLRYGSDSLTETNVAKIKQGMSQQEVLAILKEPMSKTVAPPLGEIWTYAYSEQETAYPGLKSLVTGPQTSIKSRSVTINFDDNGLVKSVSRTDVNPPAAATAQI